MRLLGFIVLISFAIVCSAQEYEAEKAALDKTPISELWAKFKTDFSKQYADESDEAEHFRHFANNVEKSRRLNAQHKSTLFGINKFSDAAMPRVSKSNVAEGLALMNKEVNEMSLKNLKSGNLKSSFFENPRTKVKDQGNCGGCYAFSSVAAIESMRMSDGKYVELSEQSILDCCNFGCHGCEGGSNYHSMRHVSAFGLPKESDYGFTGDKKSCHWGKKKDVVVDTIEILTSISDAMDHIQTHGPVLASIYSGFDLAFYTGGILGSDPVTSCDGEPDHSVAIIGFNTSSSTPYWVIKNSWGEDWGMGGYANIAMYADICHIEKYSFVGVTVSDYHVPYLGVTMFVLTLCFCIASTVLSVRAWKRRPQGKNYINE
eukprot:TRINITY_DN763_c0_g1_i1.p1 TRINITY_DN763_c0_g1~~TRINITY_DN763_c0_g1_i1.p1  ORF type:complete len:381 (-),score=89.51 TRINITY_DN763_c0_g1_i1:473-1594(-)